MTFSIPQPIPSRSSHPVHAHQRPPIRRSQSHTITAANTTNTALLSSSSSSSSSSSTTLSTSNINISNTNGQGGLVGLTTTGSSNAKFDISHLLGSNNNSRNRHHRHSLHHPDISEDISLANDDDDEDDSNCKGDEDEDVDDCEMRHDSGHYTDLSSEIRGIPIGKPKFRFFNINSNNNTTVNKPANGGTNFMANDLLFGVAGGSVDSRGRAGEDLSSRYEHQQRYSHSHSNSDSHSSINLMADNLKAAKAAQEKDLAKYTRLADDDDNEDDDTFQRQYHYHHLSTTETKRPDTLKKELLPQFPSHIQYQEQQQQQQQQSPHGQAGHISSRALLSSTTPSSSSSTSSPRHITPASTHTPLTTTKTTSSPSPAAIAIPQRTNRKIEPRATELDLSLPAPERSNTPVLRNNNNIDGNSKSHPSSSSSSPSPASSDSTYPTHHHSHAHPNISIDTSKARLQSLPTANATINPRLVTKDVPKLVAATAAAPVTTVKRAASTSQLPKSHPTTQSQARPEGQLALGLKKGPPSSSNSTTTSSSTASLSSSSAATTPATSSNSSTRPLMMASQSRLSSALPPAPSMHQHSFSAFDTQPTSSVLLPSLSPSSPRTNSALVNSLEQLSVSWKAPENTPSFPINRLHRSRTISSGTTRPSFNSSFSSNTTNTSFTFHQNGGSTVSPSAAAMVTSSSYSSLPYSPAVAFLSNFVEVTAPRMAPDEEGEQVGDFIMGKIIGHGGFSLVREAFAIHLDGLVAQVAVKIVKTQTGATDNDRVQRMLDKEIAIWSRLTHPNVLPFLAVEKLPTDTFVFCELCTSGHLLDYITRETAASSSSASTSSSGYGGGGWGGSGSAYGSSSTTGLDEDHARRIFNQVAEAVRYLHEERRIVHRDIKLENILQHEDGTWKICDFGLAEYQNDEAASYFGSPTIYNPRAAMNSSGPDSNHNDGCSSNGGGSVTGSTMEEDDEEEDMVGGSLAYCSPEQLRSQKPLRCPSSDVWSLGVVLYALLTGRLPFQDEYEPRLQHMILNGRYEDPTECSAEARDLLRHMFRSKPEDRWKIGQVMDSPWCTGTTLAPTVDHYGSNAGNGGGGGGGGGSSGFGGGFGGGFGSGFGSRW
ncbi:hypothetical protein BGZ95_007347 [Linnemannia exigua]|uniref:Protein kinase domain-containing protein n=1 Tax=Linnemannia exigua TaxID=604196 RepID=A0AAD4H8A5_9FUNG|nr:hypothetical protein BGZ95_007347 [Linnemannia exigua]